MPDRTYLSVHSEAALEITETVRNCLTNLFWERKSFDCHQTLSRGVLHPGCRSGTLIVITFHLSTALVALLSDIMLTLQLGNNNRRLFLVS